MKNPPVKKGGYINSLKNTLSEATLLFGKTRQKNSVMIILVSKPYFWLSGVENS